MLGSGPISGAPISATPSGGGGGTFTCTITETLSAVDTSATGQYQVAITESGSVADTSEAVVHISAAITESGSATDTSSSAIVWRMVVSEVLHATDHTNRGLVLPALHVVETLHAADTVPGGGIQSVHDTLSAVALTNAMVNGTVRCTVHETLSASDTVGAVTTKLATVHESLHFKEPFSSSVDGLFVVSVSNNLTLRDTVTAALKSFPVVADTLSAQDSAIATLIADGVISVSVAETLNAQDAALEGEAFTSDGIYFWGYEWAYAQGFTDLACFIAGLDCGDHAINPDGTVFVPWGSDPDGMFTPIYLINLSNSPPEGGFLQTACNIDLTSTLGNTIRVVVDIAIGLVYKSQLQVLPANQPEQSHSQYGPGLGLTRRVHQYAAQLVNAQALSFGTATDNLRPAQFLSRGGTKYPANQLFTGKHHELIEDEYDFDGMLMAQAERPLPATITSLTSFTKTYGRE